MTLPALLRHALFDRVDTIPRFDQPWLHSPVAAIIFSMTLAAEPGIEMLDPARKIVYQAGQ